MSLNSSFDGKVRAARGMAMPNVGAQARRARLRERGYPGMRSECRGGAWSAFDTGLTNMYVNALAINPQTPTTIYAGTQGGVFDLEQN